jgi:hypothetical protein
MKKNRESKMKKKIKKLLFPFLGLAALIWFLIRVIPKPSRVTYPCIRASMPLAASFVIYVMSLTSTMYVFKKARKFLWEAKYVLFTITLLLGIALSLITTMQNNQKARASYMSTAFMDANQPVGVGKGVFPGRVAWVHDVDATNENCSNSSDDYWFQDDNTDQEVVNNMLSEVLQLYTGKESDEAAWDTIFKYFNNQHNKGNVGYQTDEKIVIKINNNAGSLEGVNSSPQLCYALLDQLVNVVGVTQSDISIGDPNCAMPDETFDKCDAAFPDVTYWGYGEGQTLVSPYEDAISWSDGSASNPLPQSYIAAEYMINVPVLKKHHRAGITLTAKNHFGSIGAFTGGAWHLHYSLPCPEATGVAENSDYGVYRCFVDIIGHKDLGGKTVLYLVDAIWGSTNWGHPPIKYRMTPFNDDWPNSLFVSQDPVALESVAFDFLFYEFDEDHPTEGSPATSDKGPFPHFEGTDDYMLQAADPNNWPSGFEYDPEDDGTPISSSLGVHEHWNNATDKLYSRNFGMSEGIELVSEYTPTSIFEQSNSQNHTFQLEQNYPNPFSSNTSISYNLLVPAKVNLSIYDLNGKKIRTLVDMEQTAGMYEQVWDGTLKNGLSASSGAYLFTLEATYKNHVIKQSRTLIIRR